MKSKIALLGIMILGMVSFLSCTKDNEGSGNRIYYVLIATYDNPADHYGLTYSDVTLVSLTNPDGTSATSYNLMTPFTSAEREFPSGMTITATCESVLNHTSVTIEIWRNGSLWKSQMVPGSDNYTDVTVTATL